LVHIGSCECDLAVLCQMIAGIKFILWLQ